MRKLKTQKLLSAAIGLGMGMAGVSSVEARVWTDVSGTYSVEADFVALEGDAVTIKIEGDRLKTIPLEKLSEGDRAFAKLAARGADPAPAVVDNPPAPASAVAVSSEVSAEAELRESVSFGEGGKKTRGQNLEVKVEIAGGVAAEAYAVGPYVAESIVLEGKTFEAEEPFSIGGFETIDRSETGFFAEHPQDGVRVEVTYEDVPADTKLIELVKGSVKVMTGGTAKSVVLDGILTRAAGPIEVPELTEAGMAMKFRRDEFDGDINLSVEFSTDTKGFVGLELVGSDGKEIENMGSGSGSDGTTISHSISASKSDLADASLKIHFREGGREVELPFEVKGIPVDR